MSRIRHVYHIVLVGLVLAAGVEGFPASVAAQGRTQRQGIPSLACTPPHRLRILDLDMVPDPVLPGKKVEGWKVTIQSDRNGECQTTIELRDQDQIAGIGQALRIRPGVSVYTLQAAPEYRFQGQDRCLAVQANVGGFFSPIEAQRVFCARGKALTVWSLRE
jgi:hypothetical protein